MVLTQVFLTGCVSFAKLSVSWWCLSFLSNTGLVNVRIARMIMRFELHLDTIRPKCKNKSHFFRW